MPYETLADAQKGLDDQITALREQDPQPSFDDVLKALKTWSDTHFTVETNYNMIRVKAGIHPDKIRQEAESFGISKDNLTFLKKITPPSKLSEYFTTIPDKVPEQNQKINPNEQSEKFRAEESTLKAKLNEYERALVRLKEIDETLKSQGLSTSNIRQPNNIYIEQLVKEYDSIKDNLSRAQGENNDDEITILEGNKIAGADVAITEMQIEYMRKNIATLKETETKIQTMEFPPEESLEQQEANKALEDAMNFEKRYELGEPLPIDTPLDEAVKDEDNEAINLSAPAEASTTPPTSNADSGSEAPEGLHSQAPNKAFDEEFEKFRERHTKPDVRPASPFKPSNAGQELRQKRVEQNRNSATSSNKTSVPPAPPTNPSNTGGVFRQVRAEMNRDAATPPQAKSSATSFFRRVINAITAKLSSVLGSAEAEPKRPTRKMPKSPATTKVEPVVPQFDSSSKTFMPSKKNTAANTDKNNSELNPTASNVNQQENKSTRRPGM